MNRGAAKSLTGAGIVFCLISVFSGVFNIAPATEFSLFVRLLFFVGGIILIVISLAYYTEK